MFGIFKKKNSEKRFGQYLEGISLLTPLQREYNTIKNLSSLKKKVHLLTMPDLIAEGPFCSKLKEVEVQYAASGEATKLVGSLSFDEFIKRVMPKDNRKYVFHNILKDPIACSLIPQLIPIPSFFKKKTIRDLRISRLFAGGKYSGTHLHIHSEALNYLVSGKKLWIMFPYSDKNNRFVETKNMRYGQIKTSAMQWFLDAYTELSEPGVLDELQVFIQHEKEVVYIPAGCHHAVVNLEDVIGITYSWV